MSLRARRPLLLVLPAVALLASCGGDDEPVPPPPAADEARPGGEREQSDQPLARTRGEPKVETLVTDLDVPWDMAFLPDGRALITERPGRVRLLSRDGKLAAKPAATVLVSAIGEGGLLGLAVDPEFQRNDFVYLCFTTESEVQVARYRLSRNRLTEDATIVDGIRAGAMHDGCRIRFGPDGRLYVSTGEAGRPALAQDPDSLNGKFLRLDPDAYRGEGGEPEIFSLGHRNSQGFDWEPETDRLIEDEHGPEGDDEVNELREGANYGWPEVQGPDHGGFEPPLAVYDESIAPSGATFVSLPGSEWTGDYLIGALIGEQIRRLSFDDDGRVTTNEPLFEGEFGRVRTVVEGPDGALYALTSNRDGRGTPQRGDDRVIRIVPPAS